MTVGAGGVSDGALGLELEEGDMEAGVEGQWSARQGREGDRSILDADALLPGGPAVAWARELGGCSGGCGWLVV